MRKTVVLSVMLALALAPAAAARRLPEPVHLSMKDARSVALLQADDLAEAMNESDSPLARDSGIGRCERLTNSRARCRMVARGTYEECRGWSYSRSTDDPDRIVGWLRDLRCESISE